MPEGDASKAPEPLEFPDTVWRIGEPDLELTMAKPHKIQADGFIPYKYVFLQPIFDEDTYVESIEIRPHNRAVVHHCNAFYIDSVTRKPSKDAFITGYVPGGMPFTCKPGTAQRIPKNAMIGLQIHYVTTGKEEESTISIGFRFAGGTVQKTTHFMLLDPHDIAIPPGDAFYEMKAKRKIEKDATLLGLFTHMHLRGRDMTFRALSRRQGRDVAASAQLQLRLADRLRQSRCSQRNQDPRGHRDGGHRALRQLEIQSL